MVVIHPKRNTMVQDTCKQTSVCASSLLDGIVRGMKDGGISMNFLRSNQQFSDHSEVILILTVYFLQYN